MSIPMQLLLLPLRLKTSVRSYIRLAPALFQTWRRRSPQLTVRRVARRWMSRMRLSAETQASYTVIIDSILAASDLNSISAKRVRKGLQTALDHDITPEKDDINALIMARFDKLNAERRDPATTNGTNGETEDAPITMSGANEMGDSPQGSDEASVPVESIEKAVDKVVEEPAKQPQRPNSSHKHNRAPSSDSEELSDLIDDRPVKKRKKKISVEDDDAAFAARLQAEENSRARPTRGGATKKRNPITPKKRIKTKSAKKVKAEDDSGIEEGSASERIVNRSGGFHKPMTLSEPLSQLLGESSLSRPQTVKRIWEYVKARNLQDPNDKRQIRCDEAMKAVFKQDRVHMFTMNKILNQNLYAQDE